MEPEKSSDKQSSHNQKEYGEIAIVDSKIYYKSITIWYHSPKQACRLS